MAINNFIKSIFLISTSFILLCFACYRQDLKHSNTNQLVDLKVFNQSGENIINLRDASYYIFGAIDYNSSKTFYSLMETIDEVLTHGEKAKLNTPYSNVDNLLRNQGVLEEILEHPEYLKDVLEISASQQGLVKRYSELYLSDIMKIPDDQYLLYFLSSTGAYQATGIYFLFSIENGIAKKPLKLTQVTLDASEKLSEELINSSDTPFIGGTHYLDERENEYFYFWNGTSRNSYFSFRYRIIGGEFILQEQLIGSKSLALKDGEFIYEITRFSRRNNDWIIFPPQECESPILLHAIDKPNQSFASECNN
ncbi:MAG: hypothetical protein AAFW84_34005 [Cyanobacteria bacterium J06635_15]